MAVRAGRPPPSWVTVGGVKAHASLWPHLRDGDGTGAHPSGATGSPGVSTSGHAHSDRGQPSVCSSQGRPRAPGEARPSHMAPWRGLRQQWGRRGLERNWRPQNGPCQMPPRGTPTPHPGLIAATTMRTSVTLTIRRQSLLRAQLCSPRSMGGRQGPSPGLLPRPPQALALPTAATHPAGLQTWGRGESRQAGVLST